MAHGFGVGLSFVFGRAVARTAIPPTDITFLVISDIHACQIGDSLSHTCALEGKTDGNLIRHIKALNAISDKTWPTEIDGKPTGLFSAGTPINRPRGVVVCGDMTDGGGQMAELHEGTQLLQFSHRYQQGHGPDRIHYPVFVGLGNHDLGQDVHPSQVDCYRDELRDYVRLNHKPDVLKPPHPADNYHEASDSYSWNWDGLHLVQAHRFAGDRSKGAASSLGWLKNDLATFAGDGRPVVIFQHYGWDQFSRERWDPVRKTFNDTGSGAAHWWSDSDRNAFLDAINGYNITAIFHGHEHETPMIYESDGYDIVKPKAAYMGGFGLVRVTQQGMDIALGEAADDRGGVRFLAASRKTFG